MTAAAPTDPFDIAMHALNVGAPGLSRLIKIAIAKNIVLRLDAARPAPTEPTAIQQAYGLLWRDMSESNAPFRREARTLLLAAMTRDEQRAAISWVTAKYPVTEAEIARL